MTLTGKLLVINETETLGAKGFKKRSCVIEVGDKYPQPIEVDFITDNCVKLDRHKVGEIVDIDINIRGRAWTNPEGVTKYFNSIQGWKIELSSHEIQPVQGNEQKVLEVDDDLPF